MIKISKRLTEIAGLVPEDTRILADVGTDHGYVPIRLLEERKISGAIAMDVNRGPLMRAEENRNRYGFQSVMELRLSDGLEKLKPGEADTLLIAGMGGPLMIRILEEGRPVTEAMKTMILQPQSEIPEVRRFLIRHGFSVEAEIMLKDEGKYYMAMRVIKGPEAEWTETEYLFGRGLLQKRHPVLEEFLQKEQRVYSAIRETLEANDQRNSERYETVTAYLKAIDRALDYYK